MITAFLSRLHAVWGPCCSISVALAGCKSQDTIPYMGVLAWGLLCHTSLKFPCGLSSCAGTPLKDPTMASGTSLWRHAGRCSSTYLVPNLQVSSFSCPLPACSASRRSRRCSWEGSPSRRCDRYAPRAHILSQCVIIDCFQALACAKILYAVFLTQCHHVAAVCRHYFSGIISVRGTEPARQSYLLLVPAKWLWISVSAVISRV